MKNYKKYDVMIRKGLLFDSINESYKSYRPDFPPNISTNDIVGMANQKSRKFPNAFIVYRKMTSHGAKLKHHKLTVSQISSLAGRLWKEEPDFQVLNLTIMYYYFSDN
ncbi:13393_t:CDS:2 [Entrophospora sp. SA101]|nr:13393_t:CDS:2 [Entrophospora sp. SA101]